MLNNVLDVTAQALALVPTPEPTSVPTTPAVSDVDTNGAVTWVATRIVPLLLVILGAVFIARAPRGEISKVMTSSTVAIVGVAFIAGAAVFFALGGTIIDVLFE